MTTSIIYILYIIGVIIGWIIFYYVVKTAVKNGIKEASNDNQTQSYIRDSKPERKVSQEQSKLQQRYDNGEITFEDYQSQWNKLSS